MQQAHDRLLVVKGAGFHNGTAQHLNQAAAHRVNNDAEQDACKGVGNPLRKKGKTDEPQGGKQFRSHDALSVADPVHKLCAKYIYNQLCQEKGRGDQRDLP